jgi:cytosine/adenosine deaminase-related metal-dependent hydrolase
MSRDFVEALRVTNKAKASFDRDDLYKRGHKLIRESLECGVTSMRAHVEVDTTVEFSCLEIGLKLTKDFRHICEIQLAGEPRRCRLCS